MIRIVEANGGRVPEFRNVTLQKDGAVCGEVRFVAPSGNMSSYWRFHVIDGVAEMEPSPPIVAYDASQKLPEWFDKDRICAR